MRKCNTPKPGSQVAKPAKSSKADLPEGSWKCAKRNNINYPFGTKCNRQNCSADKPLESRNSPTEEENNDQVCIVFVECFYLLTVPMNVKRKYFLVNFFLYRFTFSFVYNVALNYAINL